LQFNRHGTLLLTSSADGTARLWETASGAQVSEFAHGEADVAWASFSPDEARVVTVYGDRWVRIWDIASRTSLYTLGGSENPLVSASLSHDGTAVVLASKGMVRILNLKTGDELGRIPAPPGFTFVLANLHPDASRVVAVLVNSATYSRSAQLFDVRTGREVANFGSCDGAATFTADGSMVVTTLNDNIRCFDTIPHRIRYAERLANARGEDGAAIVRAYVAEARAAGPATFLTDPSSPVPLNFFGEPTVARSASEKTRNRAVR
jgi:WD40 repeat protein